MFINLKYNGAAHRKYLKTLKTQLFLLKKKKKVKLDKRRHSTM